MNINDATPERLLELAGGWTIGHMASRHWSESDTPFVLLAWVSADGEVTEAWMYRGPPGKPDYRVVAAVFPYDGVRPPRCLVRASQARLQGCRSAGRNHGAMP